MALEAQAFVANSSRRSSGRPRPSAFCSPLFRTHSPCALPLALFDQRPAVAHATTVALPAHHVGHACDRPDIRTYGARGPRRRRAPVDRGRLLRLRRRPAARSCSGTCRGGARARPGARAGRRRHQHRARHSPAARPPPAGRRTAPRSCPAPPTRSSRSAAPSRPDAQQCLRRRPGGPRARKARDRRRKRLDRARRRASASAACSPLPTTTSRSPS